MKLTFKVTLELAVPEGYTPDDAAIEDYRNVLDNALGHQAGFGGLTPDDLSDEGVAVELFTVEHDKRASDKATKGRRSGQKKQKVNSPERAIIVTVVNGNKVVTCEIFPRSYRDEALVLWRQLHRDADENDTASVRISYADEYRDPEAE